MKQTTSSPCIISTLLLSSTAILLAETASFMAPAVVGVGPSIGRNSRRASAQWLLLAAFLMSWAARLPADDLFSADSDAVNPYTVTVMSRISAPAWLGKQWRRTSGVVVPAQSGRIEQVTLRVSMMLHSMWKLGNDQHDKASVPGGGA
jgi:hypothetical protein